MLVLSLCPLPYYDKYFDHTARGNVKVYYFLSEIQTAVMSTRFFFLLRAGLNYSKYKDFFSKKLCQMYGFQTSMSYTIKCELKERPARTVACIFVFFVVQYAYILRIFELPYYRALAKDNMNYRVMDDFFQSVWLVTITVTTVGYGDIYAGTIPGQLTTMVIALTGTFIMALVVKTLADNFELDTQRECAYRHILVTRKAAVCVQKSIKFFIAKKAFMTKQYLILKKPSHFI